MSDAYSKVGKRVTIVRVFHSHAQTRAYKSQLLERQGVVVAALRNGKVALVELDDDRWDCPAGIRRWPFAWDDLQVEQSTDTGVEPAVKYRAGFSWKGRQAVQHAVPPEKDRALCGHGALPLPTCGWSLTFLPTAKGACPACVQLVKSADQGDEARDLLAS